MSRNWVNWESITEFSILPFNQYSGVGRYFDGGLANSLVMSAVRMGADNASTRPAIFMMAGNGSDRGRTARIGR